MLSEKQFAKSLHHIIPDFRERKFLLAVSGGGDSMVLLYFFQQLSLNFQVAHINYNLRGEDSLKDRELVENSCKKTETTCHVYEVSQDEKPENSVQLWARNLRYKFFKDIVKKENLDYIVTAHHLNDELETFIINLSRGTGIRGLSGIPENGNRILRPLLHFSKNEILEFATKNKIPFREDKSNLKDDYLRNQIRHHITPELLKTNKDFLKNFEKSLHLLHETKNLVEEKVHSVLSEITIENNHNIILSKEKLEQQKPFVQYEILRKFGFENENQIEKIFQASSGSVFYSENFQLWIHRDTLVLKKRSSLKPASEEIQELIIPHTDSQTNFHLSDLITLSETPKNQHWHFDADQLHFPLKLRRKKTGDFFFPIGMQGRKKISKYLKDENIPVFEREKIWILTDSQDQILGIVGLRQDRRFASNEKTEHLYRIFF